MGWNTEVTDTYILLWTSVTILTVVHYSVVSRVQGVLTLDGIFAILQWVMASGTLWILDASVTADNRYAYVISVPPMIYVLTSMLVYLASASRRARGVTVIQPRTLIVKPTQGLIWLLTFSGAITVLYFVSVGHNVLLQGLRGTGENYTDLRLESYSGSRYLYPGYVNQFKNTIFPLLAVSIGAYLIAARRAGRVIYGVAASVGILLAVLGTGQRGAFVQFLLTILTFLYLLDRARFRRRASIALTLGIPPLMFSTFLLGRSDLNGTSANSTIRVARVLSGELVKRVFYDNQASGQYAFRYIEFRPIAIGQEWLQGILGILPTNSGSSLAREVFAYLYGSDRGTAPISMWGSVYYNFGVAGVFLGAVFLGIAFQTCTARILQRPERNMVELLGIASTFVILGNWVVGGPEYLLNAGLLAALFVWWIGSRIPSGRAVTAIPAKADAPRDDSDELRATVGRRSNSSARSSG
jgi:oligosaccharide repeat unit polymerase